MAKIVNQSITCACCGNKVTIERLLSFSHGDMGLSGNVHTHMQYKMEECPECHYTALDIADDSVMVTRGMLNAFRMKPGMEKITDPAFCSILKAADIYARTNRYRLYEYTLRLAAFYAEEQEEFILYKELLKQANDALQHYFEEREELRVSDIMMSTKLVDGNRRLGMLVTAKSISDEVYALIKDESDEELKYVRRLLEFENKLIENRDTAEHFVSEVI